MPCFSMHTLDDQRNLWSWCPLSFFGQLLSRARIGCKCKVSIMFFIPFRKEDKKHAFHSSRKWWWTDVWDKHLLRQEEDNRIIGKYTSTVFSMSSPVFPHSIYQYITSSMMYFRHVLSLLTCIIVFFNPTLNYHEVHEVSKRRDFLYSSHFQTLFASIERESFSVSLIIFHFSCLFNRVILYCQESDTIVCELFLWSISSL